MQDIVMPKYYIIEPSRVCNFKCFMCPNRFFKRNEKGYMTLNDFKIIIDKIAPFAKLVQLYWLGEPLSNPHIIEMIKYAKTKTDAKIIVSTNGSLMNSEFCDKLINSMLDVLIIDVDAVTDDTYKQIRIGGNYKTLENNIEYMLSINDSINIYLQFLELKINKHEKNDFIKKWKHKNCNLLFSWIDTWAGQMTTLTEDADRLSPFKTLLRQPCSDLWEKISINYKGEVNLCCHDYKEYCNLGSLLTSELSDIWNCDVLNSIRSLHMKGIYTGLCKNCIEWATKKEYEEMMMM